MAEKKIKKEIVFKEKIEQTQQKDVFSLVEKKLNFFFDVVQKTILHVQKNKTKDCLIISDVNNCLILLNGLIDKIKEVSVNLKTYNTETLVNKLQMINNEMSCIFKNYGTESLEDLLVVCFGNNTHFVLNNLQNERFILLKKYFHPIGYKVLLSKKTEINLNENVVISKDDILLNGENDTNDKSKIEKKSTRQNASDEYLIEKANNFDCFDVNANTKSFFIRVYGVKLYITVPSLKKNIMVTGYVDDLVLHYLDNDFIKSRVDELNYNLPSNPEYQNESFKKFVTSLTLKDFLIHNCSNIYGKYAGYLNQIIMLKQRSISQNIKEFTSSDLFLKRQILIQLLISTESLDNQYLAYLLFDLLSNDTNGTVETMEQNLLMDSFPWSVREYFRDAMKKTTQYTNDLSNFDINKIPLEQQICLLKTPDSVKEKAMMKLKEVKAKSEDSGSKSRQYLEGLLKIPFSVYRKEPILCLMDNIRMNFLKFYSKFNLNSLFPEIPKREKYTSVEIVKYIKIIKSSTSNETEDIGVKLQKIKNYLLSCDKKNMIANIIIMNDILKKNGKKKECIKYNGMVKEQIRAETEKFINNYFDNTSANKEIKECIVKELFQKCDLNENSDFSLILDEINIIDEDLNKITQYITGVKKTLDKAVHGHEKAKKQVERLVGQWINGEQKGMVLGFEGPPGVGKTSLAKMGISNILKDETDVSRPFAMIQLGGDSNGSSIHGHNFTYVGSTWGSIVQILMDKKCMNPIILIDEVDKISKTEHGKEIVGILTHLLDPTQNDCFQDKYFSGIDLDLSKALFILSYNDVENIDRILLDRVHRIKFDNLSLEDKLVIANEYVLPEIYKNYGVENMIEISNDVLKFIVNEYTLESGVRKMKQILNEIVGEINLDILKNNMDGLCELPIKLTIDNVKHKYFKDKNERQIQEIHGESIVGVINALWANSLGQGGVLPLQVNYYPTNKFLELKLTGSLGDVMKESINVSLTNAWNMTSDERKSYLLSKYNNPENKEVYGLHLHCPDCSTPKNGPSATAAFTCVIYSILNDVKIKNTFGITGETSFDHKVTAIGGLDCKILGSLPSGIKEYIYPVENKKDFDRFYEKYKNNKIIDGIKFYPVNTMKEVFELIFEK